ncbi:MAG: hypothetical protein M1160_02050 [Candidatus Marsarchaeota archaeon]|jgi:phosphomevalonate kinase|nr:hypothetical protein [Candidatus Marsarchaeota archaeon]MCL5111644.1 hypothetical protein [Candidatus Marsarchaeota archaeon]
MAGFDIQTSAPGKILLIGSYSVLERPNPGYVVTVDARVHVRLRYLENRKVRVSAPQFNVSGEGSIDPKTGNFDFALPKGMAVLKAAVEVPIKYLISIGADIPGFYLEAYNDAGFASGGSKIAKSGLGSSAGVTVAGITAALAASKHGSEALKMDKELIHKLAQLSHSIATGKIGSGFDVAAATYGSIIYTRYSQSLVGSLPEDYNGDDIAKAVKGNWDYSVESFGLPGRLGMVFANFVNESASTISLVSKVFEFKKRDPDRYGEIMKRLNAANLDALDALKNMEKGDRVMLESFMEHFEKGRHLTKELGRLANVDIEPDDCSQLIDRSKENGAFVAKLPGSGGKDSIVALTTKKADRQRLTDYLNSVNGLRVIDLNADNAGVRVDNVIS